MENEILDELKTELQNEPGFNEDILKIKIKGAIRDAKAARKYPSYLSQTRIENDIKKFFSDIKEIARFDYLMIGGDYETQHSENGITRTIISRDKLFSNILPFSRL